MDFNDSSFPAPPAPQAPPASDPHVVPAPPATDGTHPSASPVAAPVATLPPRRPRFRLRRSPSDVMLSGVCAGIAEELDLDPALVRIALVVLTILSSGLAAIGYLAAWVLAPVEAGCSEPTSM